jgi:hypothetical protein
MRSIVVLTTAALAAAVVAAPADAGVANTAPVLDATKSPAMAAVLEDSGAPIGAVGTAVSNLVDLTTPVGGLDNVSDPDTNAVTGIAVTAVDAALTCYYTYNDGNSWSPIPAVTASSAMLLPAGLGRVTCTAGADFEGVVATAITFRAWDQSTGSSGTTGETTTNGGSTPFSTATDTAPLVVNGTNDAPTLDSSATPTLPSVIEDAPAPSGAVGALMSSLIDLDSEPGGLDNMTDIDVGDTAGIAVFGQDGGLVCYFSLDGGDSWSLFGPVGNDTARLLAADADNRIYCRGVTDNYGDALEALFFRAWDGSSGTDGGVGDAFLHGGTKAYSDDSDSIVVSIDGVNDAPQATNMSAPETYLADTPRNLVDIVVSDDGTTVTATLTLSDPAAGSLNTGTSGATTSTYDDVTGEWAAAGLISEVNDLLAGLTFSPASGYTSTFTIATEVSDGTDSVTGTKSVGLAPVVPVVSIANAAVTEGNANTKAMMFKLSLSEATTVPVSVRFKTSNRTAKAGSDYTARDVVVSIPAGQTTKDVAVQVRGDTLVELAEKLRVTLTNPNGVTVGDGIATGSIRNDDRGLRVITPNGGEQWAAGTKHRITWLWGLLTGKITIQLMKAGVVVKTITADAGLGTGGQGHFVWKVPASVAPGKGYKIRLVSNKRPAYKDVSDHGFRITR